MWFCFEKSICCIVGALEVLGLREYWGVKLITLTDPALNLYSDFETETC
jgi:hypothetical protein